MPLLNHRSQTMRPAIEALRAQCAKAGGSSLDALLSSLIHMASNRLLRAAQRPQELALADFLVRTYESRIAREKKDAAARSAGSNPVSK